VGQTGNHFATIEYRRVISPTLLNALRFSFTRTHETDVQARPNQTPALNFFPERGQNGGVNITGVSSIGTSIFAPLLEVQNKFPLADDVIWTHGAHNVRFGGLFSRVQSNFQQQGWWGGFYNFPGIAAFLQASPVLFIGPQPGQTDSYRDFREIEVDGYIQDEWKALPRLTVSAGLRYEFVTNPTTNVHPLNTVIHPPFGTFERVPNVFGSNPATKNFDPRIGVAWDPFGDHKTAIRAGFGIFYNPIRARTYASGYYFNPPYALSFVPLPQFPNPFPGALPPPAQLVGVDYFPGATPHMYQWNFNIQRQLFESTTLTVGYVGSRGLHLYAARDVNPVLPTVVNGVQVFGVPKGPNAVGIVSNPRLNPKAAALSSEAPVGDSSYHSLQVGLNRRFSHGLQSQLSYTWSKCMDNASGTYGLEGGIPWSNPLNGSFDRGRCLFDRPHVFRLSGVYAFPFQRNILVKGWQMSGGLQVQSGGPWNVTIGFDQTGNAINGNPNRPNIVIPGDQIITGDLYHYANPAGFSLPAPGTLGNLQRDFLAGPGIVNLDYAVMKETQIKEQLRLQFRAEFFNILNHANFALPNANAFVQTVNGGGASNPTFGTITATSTASRQIQFALKLLF
jgi:TonB dependent receptor